MSKFVVRTTHQAVKDAKSRQAGWGGSCQAMTAGLFPFNCEELFGTCFFVVSFLGRFGSRFFPEGLSGDLWNVLLSIPWFRAPSPDDSFFCLRPSAEEVLRRQAWHKKMKAFRRKRREVFLPAI